jgi:hypothetical protein
MGGAIFFSQGPVKESIIQKINLEEFKGEFKLPSYKVKR